MDHKWAILACLLSLVVTVSSSDGKLPFKTGAKATSPHCCIEAEQFVLTKEQTIGLVKNSFIGRLFGQETVQELHRTGVDYTKNVLGSFIKKWYSDGRVVQEHVIEFLDEGYFWLIYPYEGKCTKILSPRGFHFVRCIPDYARYVETYSIGDTNVKVEKWQIDDTEDDRYQLSVSENCVPVSDTFAGVHLDQQMISSSIYYNFTLGIPDDGEPFFDVPFYCHEAEEESTKLKFTPPEEEEQGKDGDVW